MEGDISCLSLSLRTAQPSRRVEARGAHAVERSAAGGTGGVGRPLLSEAQKRARSTSSKKWKRVGLTLTGSVAPRACEGTAV